jgi:lipopolysaccharide/colanic/teichoic acid biosynthesis glycosyltransferase
MIRLFRVFVPSSVLALLVFDTLLITAAFILTTYLVMEVDPAPYLLYDGGLVRIFVMVLTILAGLHLQDFYSRFHVQSRIVLLQDLCVAIGWALLLQGLISYLDPDLKAPMQVVLWGSLLTLAAMFLWRVFFSAHALEILGLDRLLLVGDSPLLEDIARHVGSHPELGLLVAGYVRDSPSAGAPLPGGKILGPMASLRDAVETARPDRIVVGLSERGLHTPIVELLELRFAGYTVEEAASAYERIRGRVSLKELRPSQLMESGELGPRPRSVLYQGFWNIALAAVGIAVTAPIMAIAALSVKLSSPGPILHRQPCAGLHDSVFTLYKFRTTRVDDGDGPRMTRLGSILRQLRIDDLPQLFNVLKRDMSLVGPHPERPEFVAALSGHIPYYRQRHCVRPGIIGWAQMNFTLHGELLDTVAKLERDFYYIKNMSFGMDTFIMFHAVKALTLSRGSQ